MKTTLAWLKTHLETGASLEEIVATLVMRGFEVESIDDRARELAPFTVALIAAAEPHQPRRELSAILQSLRGTVAQSVAWCGAKRGSHGQVRS